MAPDVLAAVGGGLTRGNVELYLPRWAFDTDADLVSVLQALGLEVPFTPEADFSGITDGDLWIFLAIHRATITVDESGTEASAVTGFMTGESGPPPIDLVFRVDRPFAFVILDTVEQTPLFLGLVADPSA